MWLYTAAGVLTGAVAAALLYGYRRLGLADRRFRIFFYTALSGLAAAGIAAILLAIARNALHPAQWDFLVFWINGTAAAHGGNYYDPRLAAILAQPFHPTEEF